MDVDPELPTLGWSSARPGDIDYYLLCQPGDATIKPRAALPGAAGVRLVIVVVLITFIYTAVVALSQARPQSAGGWVVAAIAAVIGGLLAAFFAVLAVGMVLKLIFALLKSVDERRALSRPELFARVTPQNRQAWRLCEAVHGLVGCRSWKDKTVDPQRSAASMLWSAVQRSLLLEEEQAAVERARAHPSLDQLAHDAADKVDRERDALATVTGNLEAILAAASEIDRTRTVREQQQRHDREYQQEEQELLATLLDASTSVDADRSEQRADVSSGLAAEAEVIAELFAKTDRILHS